MTGVLFITFFGAEPSIAVAEDVCQVSLQIQNMCRVVLQIHESMCRVVLQI